MTERVVARGSATGGLSKSASRGSGTKCGPGTKYAQRQSSAPRRVRIGGGRMPKIQLELALTRGWGGARKGAGRKRVGRPKTPHVARQKHLARHPVHVTMRSEFRQLRHQFVFPSVRVALDRAARHAPERFRILQWSVQYDHVHLVVEASGERELSRGMQGLAVRIARYVNDLLGRRGRFWADRWHGRELTSPRAVRNALLYVLANFRKHARGAVPPGVDALSSGVHFDGWAQGGGIRLVMASHTERAPPRDSRVRGVVPAESWLAKVGWRRHGLLRVDEQPLRPE